MDRLGARIQQRLHHPSFFRFTLVQQVDSTNQTVKDWGAQGQGEGAVLIARRQTAGRGRQGRRFYSPDGSGIYFSLLLRPPLPGDKALRITAAAAVAVAQTLGPNAQIKWVNDVFLHGRKVCGILTESGCSGSRLDYAVLGIGLNLTVPSGGFPPELRGIAGGIFEQPPDADTVADLLARFFDRFYELYQDLESPAILRTYEQRNLLQGKTVTAGAVTGRVEGIDEAFRLLVRDEQGQVHPLFAGEATIGSAIYKGEGLC